LQIRDRIKELRRVRASELRPNPRNWRTHPVAQQNAMRGLLAEVGYADALLVRELPDGSLELIDGHLRAETTPLSTVPVLVLDVTEAEADKILATHDPLAAMAETDRDQFNALLKGIDAENDAVKQMLDDMARSTGLLSAVDDAPNVAVPETYQVVVECEDEEQQRQVYGQLKENGYKCRVITL